MKLTREMLEGDGVDPKEVKVADLRDFCKAEGIDVDCKVGKKKTDILNEIVDALDGGSIIHEEKLGNGVGNPSGSRTTPMDAGTETVSVAPPPTAKKVVRPLAAPPVAPIPTTPAELPKEEPIVQIAELPASHRRANGRNELPCPNSIESEVDTGTNWHNRRRRIAEAGKTAFDAAVEAQNEESRKTSYIARRLRSNAPTKKGNN